MAPAVASVNLFLVVVLMVIHAAVLSVTAQDPDVDTKRYSYVCLEQDQDLCLGISPGADLPYYNPNAIFYLQVKSREKQENATTDFKKTRWDLSYGKGRVALSRFSDLCAVKEAGTNRAMLYPCNATATQAYREDRFYGKWDLDPLRKNVNGAAPMMLSGNTRLCLTPMRCAAPMNNTYCDPTSNFPAFDPRTNLTYDLRRGAYLRFLPCWNAPGGNKAMKSLQIWRQRLDCAVGCTPALQENGVCDAVCNTAKCGYDNGDCITASPTRPTNSPTLPTNSPTIPTKNPTNGPTAPTTKTPTNTPTAPTIKTPTNTPTAPTTKGPTSTPTFPTTQTPTQATKTPTAVPTSPTSPTVTARPTTKSPTTLLPSTSPITSTPTFSPTVTCPATGVIEFCNRWTRLPKQCKNSPRITRTCTFCQGACRPKADPRVCQVKGFFDHCPVKCPSVVSKNQCERAQTRASCVRKGKADCTYCASTKKCLAGRDSRVCSNPDFFSHCDFTSAPLKCPDFALVNRCQSRMAQSLCRNTEGCVWCASATTKKCRPAADGFKNYCALGSTYLQAAFSHCSGLFPTASPSA